MINLKNYLFVLQYLLHLLSKQCSLVIVYTGMVAYKVQAQLMRELCSYCNTTPACNLSLLGGVLDLPLRMSTLLCNTEGTRWWYILQEWVAIGSVYRTMSNPKVSKIGKTISLTHTPRDGVNDW